MEINAKPPVPRAGLKQRIASDVPKSDGPFAQIFKNAVEPANTAPLTPAAATLANPAPTRSLFFMRNMPIELRRSATESEHFKPQSAALEPQKGAGGRVLLQNAVDGR